MKCIQDKRYAILLSVCYLSQLVIATARPSGLPAGVLVLLFAAGALLQLVLYRLLSRKQFFDSKTAKILIALLLSLAAGYDFTCAERFYRAVAARQLSFWWLIGCMLLIGWYAAHCGRDTVLRAAQPVLVVLLLSLVVLAASGSYRLESLSFVRWEDIPLRQMTKVFVEYTFSTELLLWLYWNTHPQPSAVPQQRAAVAKTQAGILHGGWKLAIRLQFFFAALFAVLGELALGTRAAQTPQLFGVLSLISSGADAGHGSTLYHCVWLTALAVRVCAHCCVLTELWVQILPQWTEKGRMLFSGILLIGAAILWEALWRQECTIWLGVAVLLFAAAAHLHRKERGETG